MYLSHSSHELIDDQSLPMDDFYYFLFYNSLEQPQTRGVVFERINFNNNSSTCTTGCVKERRLDP